jgi:hypothetical protein
VIVNGWIDWAERRDGPANKQFPQANAGIGIACHSVVGDLPNHAIPARFFDPKDSASVMFILYHDGHVTQMYPVTSSTWTSGSYAANTMYWAIEAEGGGAPNYGKKLTVEAEDSFIRLVTEWEEYSGRVANPGGNILQHKELVVKYGGGATACASDRYSNAWARVAAGERYDSMTPEERAKLDAVYLALTGGVPGVITKWNEQGNSVLVAYNDIVFPHIAEHPVTDHEHDLDFEFLKTGGVNQ